MRRVPIAISLAACVFAACAGGGRGSARPGAADALARPLDVYQDIGMLAGAADFPAVARIATLAGPADSTYLIFSMSLPSSALRFLRDQNGFHAQYRVHAVLLRDSQQVKQLDRTETVRVASFAETNRTEESIVFQDVLTVQPGRYLLQLQVNDLNSSRGFSALDTLRLPAFPRDTRLGTPVIVYQAAPRNTIGERPAMIINPRNTVPFGADTPRVYLELYGAAQPEPVTLRVVDETGAQLWSAQTPVSEGSQALRHALVSVPASNLPVGRLWLEATTAHDTVPLRTPLLVTISDQWMVANFSDVLAFLEYVASPVELDSLRQSTGAQRRELWDRFWAKRDPLPATPINEFREQFFERVRIATDQFRESGRPGWESDRGRVFIVLGPPDDVFERQIGRDTGAQPNLIEWLYDSVPGGRMVLQFVDRNGFGRFELTQGSEAEFRSIAARMRPRN